MFDAGDGQGEAQDALVLLRDGVDELLDADLTTLAGNDLLDLLRDVERQRRRLAAVDAALLAEIDMRGLAAEHSCNSTPALVSALLGIDPGEAAARVRASAELATRHAKSGQTIPPIFPVVAAAVRAGDISPAHARAVTTTIDALPADVQAEHGAQIETDLVEHARRFRPRELRVICRRLHDTYDQDGPLASDADRLRRRRLDYRQHSDGSVSGEFCLEPVTGEAFLTSMDAALSTVTAAERGERTPTQIRHDALRDLLLLALRSGELPATGGAVATILLTLTPDQLAHLTSRTDETGRGTAAQRPPPGSRLVPTGHGALIGLDAIRPLLGDSQVLPVTLTRTRGIDSYGDKQRLFTENQRLAMAARDHGCSFPGCTVGPAWTEAHHVIPWATSRRTSVANGTLLCPTHHRHAETRGWTCRMIDGRPHWTPPAWLDPDQTPQVNTAHTAHTAHTEPQAQPAPDSS